MKIVTDKNLIEQTVTKVHILLGDVEFRVSVNKFNELVVNKMQLGSGDSAMVIKPSVSNEIRIS